MNEETRNRLIGEDQAEKWEQGYNVAVTDYKARLLAKMEELKAQYPQNGDHFDKHFIIQEVRKIVEEL